MIVQGQLGLSKQGKLESSLLIASSSCSFIAFRFQYLRQRDHPQPDRKDVSLWGCRVKYVMDTIHLLEVDETLVPGSA